MNRAEIIGNIGNDVSLQFTNTGKAVLNLRVASNDKWTDSTGQRQERTEWHRVTIWGKLAETCGEHLSKGRQVMVTGTLRTRAWEDRDGNKRYTTEIHARNVQFLGGRPSSAPVNETPVSDDESVPF